MVEQKLDATKMTVSQFENMFAKAYSNFIQTGIDLHKFPSVMLWGAPGVGKSQGVRHMAKVIAEKTGKRVEVTDVRLLLFNPIDLRGIPTANEDKTLAVWLKPKVFQMDERDDVINILFLDEISAAPQSVQAAAYQIVLDRTIGEHRLPDNCIVIAAGNRITDRSVAYAMPKALANRLMHIEIVSSATDWHEWANSQGIHPYVIGFIDYNPDALMGFGTPRDDLAFPTPRSWEMVSNVLNNISDDMDEVMPMIAGCVGNDVAYSFKAWSEMYDVIPKIESVFDGTAQEAPQRPEVILALASQMSAYIRFHHSASEVQNALDYVFSMPIEYRSQVLADFLAVEEIRGQLRTDDRFVNWFMRSGRDWDDYL